MGINVAIDDNNSSLEISIGVTIAFTIDGYTPQTAVTVEGIDLKGTGVNEEEVSTKEDPTPTVVIKEEDPTPTVETKDYPIYATGPIYYSHTTGRSGYVNERNTYKITCPACSFEMGKLQMGDVTSWKKSYVLIKQGFHVENDQVLGPHNITPYKDSDIDSIGALAIDGESISRRGPPSFGLDVICPECAFWFGRGGHDEYIYKVRQGKHCH